MALDPADLRELSALLDQGLARPPAARAAWIDGLHGPAARWAPQLRRLLLDTATGAVPSPLDTLPAFAAPPSEGGDGPRAGDAVGPYRLLRLIGCGGMGEVWLAERHDGQLRRQVALKLPMLALQRNVLVQRFARERDILAALAHPHIARLYDAGLADDGQPYLALEAVEGEPITRLCDQRGLDVRARLRLMLQVLDAVQHAHAHLVIHRDIKPSNVLVTAEGHAMLLDFGIAKLLQPDDASADTTELTRTGGQALTLHYAAPEQIQGEAVSIAADVWSLGVLLYELLCGCRPFEADSRRALEQAILAADPPPPGQHRRGARATLSRSEGLDLDTVVLKALRRRPQDRYPTALALAEDLQRWLGGLPVTARPDHLGYRLRKAVTRHRWKVAAGAVATVALLATAVVATVLGQQAREESARATAARDFLIDLFRQIDPENSRGQEPSARQLLEQGRRSVLASADMPLRLRAELLRGIGEAQANMGDYRQATLSYDASAAHFHQAGDGARAGEARVHQASVVYLAGDVTRAAALLDEAWPLVADAGAAAAAARVMHHQFRSSIALARGQGEAALAAARVAHTEAERAFGPDDARTIQALATLGRIEGSRGAYADALAHYDAALARAGRQPQVHPRKRLWMQVEQAQVMAAAGRYRQAAEHLARTGADCEALLDRRSVTCSGLRRAEASLWLVLGFHDRAAALLPAYAARIDNDQAPQDQVEALLTACRTELLQGRPGATAAWWQRLRTIADAPVDVPAAVPASHPASARLPERLRLAAGFAEAEHQLLASRPEAALARLRTIETQVQVQGSGRGTQVLRAQVQTLQGLALQELGELDAALQALQAAESIYAELFGADSARTALLATHQARARWALGDRDGALALLDRHLPRLREAMGEDAPNVLRLQQLRQQLASGSANARRRHPAELFM